MTDMTDEQLLQLINKLEDIRHTISMGDSSSELSTIQGDIYDIRNDIQEIKSTLVEILEQLRENGSSN